MTTNVGVTLAVAHSGSPLQKQTRERAVIVVFVCAAIASGIFAAVFSLPSAATVATIVFFVFAGFVLPRAWIPIALAILIPFQFYISFAGALNLRGATLFVFAAALRLLIERGLSRNWSRWYVWMIPAALFLLAATVSAIGAANRYAAFKGIYDWLPVFAAAFVVSESLRAEYWLKRLLVVLSLCGIAQAVLGLVQSRFSLSQAIDWMRLPWIGIFSQPNVVRDRLEDFSFNWILDGRVLPFGTFINDIDFAVFMAAALALILGLLLASRHAGELIAWTIGATAVVVALVLTFKGSGMIALAGVSAIMLTFVIRRFDARIALFVLVLSGVISVAAFFFFDSIGQRILYLVQRELGLVSVSGRSAIWAHLLTHLPERWGFGFGLNNADWLVDPLPSARGGEFIFAIPAAESAYIAALIETGLVGFAALIAFLGAVLARAIEGMRTSVTPAWRVGILAALVAIVLGNLTVVGLTSDQIGILFGVLIGMVFAGTHGRT